MTYDLVAGNAHVGLWGRSLWLAPRLGTGTRQHDVLARFAEVEAGVIDPVVDLELDPRRRQHIERLRAG